MAGMEAFMGRNVTADDPRLELVYDRFRMNLDSICDVRARLRRQVLLATVATNLQGLRPLAAVIAGPRFGTARGV